MKNRIFITLFLVVSTCISLAFTDQTAFQVVTRRSGSESVVKPGGVIGTQAIVRIEFTDALKPYLEKIGLTQGMVSVKDQLEEMELIAQQIQEGKKALDEYNQVLKANTNRNSLNTELRDPLKRMVQVLKELLGTAGRADIDDTEPTTDLGTFIQERVDATPLEQNNALKYLGNRQAFLMGIAFNAAADYLDIRRAQLNAQIANPSTTILQYRINQLALDDPTRRRGIRFLEELSPDDQQRLASLRGKLAELGDNPVNAILQKRKDELVVDAKSRLKDYKDLLQNRKTEIQGLIDNLKQSQKEAIQPKWDAVKVNIEKCQSIVDKVSLANYLNDIQNPTAGLNQLRSDLEAFQTLYTSVEDLYEQVQTLASGVDTAVTSLLANLKGIVDATASDTLVSLKGLFAAFDVSIKATLAQFNLVQSYIALAEVLLPATPVVNLGTLEKPDHGLEPQHSGDKIVITLEAVDGSQKTTIESNTYYVYKLGWNVDRSFATVFTTRFDRNAWTPSIAYADTYKNYGANRGRNNLAPGFGALIGIVDQDGSAAYAPFIGATISFFDDRLFSGYGYNTALKRGSFFFGLRIQL